MPAAPVSCRRTAFTTSRSPSSRRRSTRRRASRMRRAPTTSYRALAGYSDNYGNPNTWRASASYVTGAHNMKVGYQGSFLMADSRFVRNPTLLSYRFNNGVPNQFTMNIPEWTQADRTSIAAFYVQDAWTRGRLTLQGALRYDRAWSFSPAEHNGTEVTSRVNLQPITLPRTASVRWLQRHHAALRRCLRPVRQRAGRPSSSTWAAISTPRPTTAPTRATARRRTSCAR